MIEDQVIMSGSIRTLQPAAREKLLVRLEALVSSCAAAYSCEGRVKISDGVPALINDATLYEKAKAAAEKCFGPISNFAIYGDKVALITGEMTEKDAVALCAKLNGCKAYRLL
jgi:metal-dependent amidase/aminoacylase/carboxypeptidase family protein